MTPAHQDLQFAFGRLCLTLPRGSRVIDCSAQLRGIGLYDQMLDYPAVEAERAAWADLLELKRDEGFSISSAESQGNLRIARCSRPPLDWPLAIMAAAARSGRLLVLQAGQLEDQAAEANASDVIRALARDYEVVEPQRANEHKELFFLQHGAIGLRFGDREEIAATILLLDKTVELGLVSYTVDEPETAGADDALEDLRSIQDLDRHGVTIEPIRSGERRIDRFTGPEAIYRVETPGEDSALECYWTFAGEPGSAIAPAIQIEMSSPADDVAAMLQLWDRVTSSLRSLDCVPGAQGRERP